MIVVEETSIKRRYNLINDELPRNDEDFYMRQLSREEVIALGKSIIDLLDES